MRFHTNFYEYADSIFEGMYGRVVTDAYITNGTLFLTLRGLRTYRIFDGAGYCCEYRHMTCDDNPADLIGGRLVSIEAREGSSQPDEYGESHDTCFVIVKTDQWSITLTNHNEHNGYYGGFDLTVEKVVI